MAQEALGSLVMGPYIGQVALNLSVQRYAGRRALTWWQGKVLVLGFGQGVNVVADRRYRIVDCLPQGIVVNLARQQRLDVHVVRLGGRVVIAGHLIDKAERRLG